MYRHFVDKRPMVKELNNYVMRQVGVGDGVETSGLPCNLLPNKHSIKPSTPDAVRLSIYTIQRIYFAILAINTYYL